MLIDDCSQIKKHVSNLPLVRFCDQVRSGAFRMSTPFSYPNGDNIDLFLENRGDIFENFLLSDYGMTSVYLSHFQVQTDSSRKRAELIEDIASGLGVSVKNGMLQVIVEGAENPDFSDAILRLSQACVKVSDLAYHARRAADLSFKQDIGNLLTKEDFPFKPDEKVPGIYGRDVKVDFLVVSKVLSYLLIVANRNESSLHSRSNEVFIKWDSVERTQNANLITVVKEPSLKMMRSDDKQRIERYSQLLVYPEKQRELVSILQGAA